MTVIVRKPIYIDPASGFPTALPDASIVNIGGTNANRFTIGGKPVMLADGTAADGIGDLGLLNFQTSYDNSSDIDGNASVVLSAGKDFIIKDADDITAFFKVDSVTGAVTIAGDLIVSGTRTVVETSIIDADHYSLTPRSPNTVALSIVPDAGVTLLAPILDIRASHNGPAVFVLSNIGELTLSENLTVSADVNVTGLINGVDVVQVKNQINQHTSVDFDKHQAREINIWPGSLDAFPFYPATTRDIQAVVEILSAEVNSALIETAIVQSDVATLSTKVAQLEARTTPFGYTHRQETAALTWDVIHGANSKNFIYMMFDDNGYQVIPDQFIIISPDVVRVAFTAPMAGQMNMMFYPEPSMG